MSLDTAQPAPPVERTKRAASFSRAVGDGELLLLPVLTGRLPAVECIMCV